MENSVESSELTRGQKIGNALRGKNWSPERKAAFRNRVKELKALYEKTDGKEGSRFGRPAKSKEKVGE